LEKKILIFFRLFLKKYRKMQGNSMEFGKFSLFQTMKKV